jgi:hypothetical protein
MSPPRLLSALLDGVPLAEEEARALWDRFSTHMDEHQGDLAGFARAEGFASVHPETRDGRAVLVASRTEPQRPYGVPPPRSGGGSGKPQPGRPEGAGKRRQ